jgi:fanconi anemia group D2 protein
LKHFLGNGFVMLESCLKKCPERVMALLKKLQGTTRYLHSLCCQSKAIKDNSIIAQIPLIRQTIENLVYRVKAALAANKCNSAFWMGNLKNKDLHGEEILSQLSQVVSEVSNGATNSTGEDVIPDDDSEEEDSLEDAMLELHGGEGTSKHDSTDRGDNDDDEMLDDEEREKRKSDIFSKQKKSN